LTEILHRTLLARLRNDFVEDLIGDRAPRELGGIGP
jgi:hypothetical protein